MKLASVFSVILLLLLLTACHSFVSEETTVPEETTGLMESETAALSTVPESTAPLVSVVELTEEEKTMLLKIGMAELGNGDCTECIALVMRTVLNRVESGRFGSSIRSVLLSPEQFTPVMDGTYYSVEPNSRCYEALDLIISGWDESQGALFYEWCEGESWHSKNLHLLFQHCDTRFYD